MMRVSRKFAVVTSPAHLRGNMAHATAEVAKRTPALGDPVVVLTHKVSTSAGPRQLQLRMTKTEAQQLAAAILAAAESEGGCFAVGI